MAMGRPRKEIDKAEFEKLCAMQCTRDEICGWFDVSQKTLEGWCKRTYGDTFSPVFNQKRSIGKISLRRAQYQAALGGNTALLIWLGRNYLGQTDKVEIDLHESDAPDDGLSASLRELASGLESDER